MKISDKVLVVTGRGNGIGRQVVLDALGRGARWLPSISARRVWTRPWGWQTPGALCPRIPATSPSVMGWSLWRRNAPPT